MLVTCQSVTTVVHLIQHLQLTVVLYIIFTHNEHKKSDSNFLESFLFYGKMSLLSGTAFRRENVEVKVKSF